MDDRFYGITTFVQVVEAGSFALAAERAGLTRSAVGKIVARLEQRLGVRLFHRTTRQHKLTEEGQAYYEHCVRALGELDVAEAGLGGGTRRPHGRLRVSAPKLLGRHCVAPIMRPLARRHAELHIDMSFNDRVVDLVEEGFDLAVRIGPLPDSATLVARSLGIQRMAIGAAPSYLAGHGPTNSAEALDGHAGVAYVRGGKALPWIVLDDAGRPRHVQADVRLRFDDLQAIADAAIAGEGLAWLPCWLLQRYVRTGELALVRHSAPEPANEIHAVWPHTSYLPSKARVAIDALIADMPPMLTAR
jgi:DNA-binding transcriptional LysR family regulator